MFEARPSAGVRRREAKFGKGLGTRIWSVVGDPLECSIVVVAALPIVAVVAAASVVWWPLAYVAAVAGVFWCRPLARVTRRRILALPQMSHTAVTKFLAAIAVVGVLGSVPVAQAFLAGDLDAMAAPAIAAEQSGASNVFDGLPAAIYGPSNGVPSYRWCQVVQDRLGVDIAHPCYTQIGYLRLWQMPVALTTLVSITLIYAVFPLAIAWHVRSRPLRRSPHSSSRFAKESA
nr:hypothetical protein [Rhodococcus sp. (in: high G+C Gram-positive bacteria)]